MTDRAQSHELTTAPRTELRAILFLDLVQSSRLMEEREQETITFLERSFDIFNEYCEHHGGEIVKSTGDGALIVFSSANAAIEYTMKVISKVDGITGGLGRLAAFRAGLHIGEIQTRDNDVFGSAVNIAARLEGFADPGGICVSDDVYRMTNHNQNHVFTSIGKHKLKNISGAMHLYKVAARVTEVVKNPVNQINITTIGGLSISSITGQIELPKGDKSKGLLAYLSVVQNGYETEGTLASILWPDRLEVDAVRLLSGVLQRISRIVPISKKGVSIRLQEDSVNIDLRAIESGLNSGSIHPILNRHGNWPDQILAGSENTNPLFASWLMVMRYDWRLRISSLLENCLEQFQNSDTKLRDAAFVLIRMEPCHERAARYLIRHYHSVDNPGGALRVFDQLALDLRSKLGMNPKAETVAASKGNQSAQSPETRRSTSAPLRIQIGGFHAANNQGEHIIEGFRNELLSGLASFRGWSVVESEQQANAKIGVSDYQLSGEYSDTTHQISLTLIDPNDGRTIWKGKFDLDADKFQSAIRNVVGRVAATLEVYVSSDRVNSAMIIPSHSAIDLWLRGERLHTRWTPEANDEAADIFAGLIDREPEFAPPYASLASIHNVRHIVRPGISRDSVASQNAYRLANRAVELDPLDARNQLAVAWSASLEGDFDKAMLHMNMAARLNPNSPRTTVSCAMGFAFFGDHDRAAELVKHSLRCAPQLMDHQWCYAASVYFLAGDFDRALAAAKLGHDRIIDNPGWHAAILMKLGKEQEATVQFNKLVNSISSNWHRNEPATPKTVCDWFVEVYPIRRSEERELLVEALETVVRREPG